MCGRYFMNIEMDDLISSYNITDVNSDDFKKGEVFPGTRIPVITSSGRGRTLTMFRWGYKLSGVGRELINARIETVLEKPLFRKSAYNKRCIIPANSFYEWKGEGNGKIKYEISLKDSPLFSMAGIYEDFTDSSGRTYSAVVILTKEANNQMSEIHERMPVILSTAQEETWLSVKNSNINYLIDTLRNSSSAQLIIKPSEGMIQLSF